jgi:SHS2 domain-containing protein
MDDRLAGYLEIEHTADWALKVWAPDLAGLIEQASQGMAALSGVALKSSLRMERRLYVEGYDPEHLLVNFLSEILFIGEEEGIGFDRFDLKLDNLHLEARLSGAPIASQQKEIKAVTYHDLQVQTTSRGVEAMIVFDV